MPIHDSLGYYIGGPMTNGSSYSSIQVYDSDQRCTFTAFVQGRSYNINGDSDDGLVDTAALRSELEGQERLAPNVDLVSHPQHGLSVFKHSESSNGSPLFLDSFVLSDFGQSALIGTKSERGFPFFRLRGDDPKRDDSHYKVPLTAMQLRDDAALLADTTRWLSTPTRRANPMVHYTQAPRHFNCPRNFEDRVFIMERKEAEENGMPFVEWRCPSSLKLDRSRRLLATGCYADETLGESKRTAAAPRTAAESEPGATNNECIIKLGVPTRDGRIQPQKLVFPETTVMKDKGMPRMMGVVLPLTNKYSST
ncbi:hypothetical protein B0T26DRAFT_873654 [Lasiosphaeria miniovina]|uniref:Uncharacterized protein n=1 Tax=Lasiosphaeria miniovina TaxID=1954250 RepID=A0AA40ACT6_9PEZI|nr:uncharacterized protein B0T26DRAFT_873654 [Lasiosphaeria miniovina]KAK0713517.1 hypothetical protein B0T26DRAFT_873654 [Lasiosphaeria miniovina]